MATIGSLTADLVLRSASFMKNMERASQATQRHTAQMKKSMRQVETASRNLNRQVGQLRAGVAALAGVVAVRQFQQFAKAAVANADAVQKTADKLGIGAKALQQYRVAAELTGVAQNTLDMGLQRFTRRVGEAAQGSGELRKILERYNIAVTDSEGRMRRTRDVLLDLSDAMAGAGSAQERLVIAFKAFDSEGAALVNTFGRGREAVQAFMDQAVDLGLVYDKTTLQLAEQTQDRMSLLRRSFQIGFDTEIIRAFSRALDGSTQQIVQAGEIGRQLGEAVGESMRVVAEGAIVAARNLREIAAGIGAIVAFKAAVLFGSIAAAVVRYGKAVVAAARAQQALNVALSRNPIGLIAVAVSTAVSALILYGDSTVEIGGKTVEVGRVIVAVWRTIVEPIKGAALWLARFIEATGQLLTLDLSGAMTTMSRGGEALIEAFNNIREAWSDLVPETDSASDSLTELEKRLEALAGNGGGLGETADAVDKVVESLKRQNDHLELMAEAVKRGEDAVDKLQVAEELQAKLLAADLIPATLRLDEVMNLVTMTENERIRQIAVLVKQNAEYQASIDATTEAQDEAAKAAEKAAEEQRRVNERAAEFRAEPFKNALEDIQRTLTDTFEDALSGTLNSFEDFGDAFMTILRRLIANVAAQRIVVPLVVSAAGAFGLGAADLGLPPGVGGAGVGGVGNLLDIGGLFGQGGVGGFVNSTIGPALGFFNPAAPVGAGPFGVAGGSVPGNGLFGTTTFGQFLGGAGAGLGAGMLLNGLLGGNRTGGMIGSGLGSLAGATIGSMVPGVGTLIGGLIGGAGGGILGGLFGNDELPKQTATAVFGADRGRLRLRETLADDLDRAAARRFSEQTQTAIQRVQSVLGADVMRSFQVTSNFGENPRTAIASNLFGGFPGRVVSRDPGDIEAVIRELLTDRRFVEVQGERGALIQRQVRRVLGDTDDLDEALEAGRFLKTVFQDLQDPITQAGKQLQEFEKFLGQFSDRAERLVKERLAERFDQEISAGLRQIRDPRAAALADLREQATIRRRTARRLGADIGQVDELTAIQEARINRRFDTQATQLRVQLRGSAGDEAEAVQEQIRLVWLRFAELAEQAEALGVSSELVADARREELEALREQRDLLRRGVPFFTDADLTNPAERALVQQRHQLRLRLRESAGLEGLALNDRIRLLRIEFAELAELADELRIPMELVNEARRAEIAALREESDALRENRQQRLNQAGGSIRELFDSLINPLRNSVFNFSTGDLSALSPQRQFEIAQRRFRSTLTAARGGDLAAIEALPGLGQTFLREARDFGASGPIFADAFREVNRGLSSLADRLESREERVFDRLGNIFTDSVAAQTETLDDRLEELVAAVRDVQREMRRGNDEAAA